MIKFDFSRFGTFNQIQAVKISNHRFEGTLELRTVVCNDAGTKINQILNLCCRGGTIQYLAYPIRVTIHDTDAYHNTLLFSKYL